MKDPKKLDLPGSFSFLLIHAVGIAGPLLVGFSWKLVGLCALLYYTRMAATTIGYHRYFSHRSFKTSRAFQFVLAVLAETSAQKGVLWWASRHRVHHKFSDLPGDTHSPKEGFFHSHMGWI